MLRRKGADMRIARWVAAAVLAVGWVLGSAAEAAELPAPAAAVGVKPGLDRKRGVEGPRKD